MKNLLITLKSLTRNKLYSFLVLSCIAVTFSIVIVVASMYFQMFGQGYPENNASTLYVVRISETDTITGYSKQGGLSKNLVKELKKNINIGNNLSVISIGEESPILFLENEARATIKYIDSDFFKATSFAFNEGRALNTADFQNNQPNIVITSKLKDKFFSKEESVLNKEVTIKGENFKIVGVVNEGSSFKEIIHSDLYVPSNYDQNLSVNNSTVGNYSMIINIPDNINEDILKSKFYSSIDNFIANYRLPITYFSNIESTLDTYVRNLFGGIYSDGKPMFYFTFIIVIFLFLLLPAINISNLNLARISERNIEIALRKSFGANSRNIIRLFIIENLIITSIGFFLALIVARILIYCLDLYIYPDINLVLSLKVIAASLVVAVIFAISSAIIPARKISKSTPILILKNS